MANSAEFQIFNVRLPAGTVERIQRYRNHLNRTQPGIEATTSTAGRMLLFRALEQVEKEMDLATRDLGTQKDLKPRRKT
jgi:hypothetical protein